MSDNAKLIAHLRRKAEFFKRGSGANETFLLMHDAANHLETAEVAATDYRARLAEAGVREIQLAQEIERLKREGDM